MGERVRIKFIWGLVLTMHMLEMNPEVIVLGVCEFSSTELSL